MVACAVHPRARTQQRPPVWLLPREAQLEQFRKDPSTSVLLVSMRTGGGAAGLTLTMATYGFILEPSLNVSAP